MRKYIENGMYAVVAEQGMVIQYATGYCHKLYREEDDFSDCTEVDASTIPTEDEEATETDYQNALSEMGVEV